MQSGTKDKLFNLAFWLDVVILVEIGINSLWMAHFDTDQNESILQANLDLLEEIKENASVKVARRQR